MDVPCYIINLDSKPELFNRSLKNVMDSGFKNVMRIPAVNGNELPNEYLKNILTVKTYNDLDKPRENHEVIFNKPGVGCFLSHIKIWEEMLKNNQDWVLVLEDDVELDSNFKNNYTNFINHIGLDTDLVLLGYTLLRHAPKRKENKLKIEGLFWGTHCYLISKEGARKALENCYPMELQVDAYLGMNSKEKMKVEAPMTSLAGQYYHPTSIQTMDLKSFMPRSNYSYILILFLLGITGYSIYNNKKCN